MSFIPLNVFTNYALLQSALTLDDYLKTLKNRNIKAAGVSDPDTLFSYPHFAKKSREFHIKPLYGVRLNFEGSSLVIYPQNEKGYRELLALLEVKNKRELTLQDLKENSTNLIVIIPSSAIHNLELKEQIMQKYFYNFAINTTSLYIGLERENAELTAFLREFSDKYNYALVAFPLIKYAKSEDHKTLLMIEAIREGKSFSIYDISSGPDYILSDAELNNYYSENELKNTHLISDLINFDLSVKHDLNFPLPGAYDPNKKIDELTLNALKAKGLDNNKKYIERLTHELSIIRNLGYVNYFLIVSDYVNFAKKAGILVGYGRGSAPGSLVSYLLGITHADPLEHNLLFERFLNPERVSLPDIDIDFMDIRRGEVIDYIKKTYGEDKVANIVTFQTNAAKASLRDTGNVFNIDPKFINRLSNSLGNTNYNFRDAYRNIKAFRDLVDNDTYNLEIIKNATKIEGFPRQSGLHAAGIIIDGEPLAKNLPTFFNNGLRVTQYEMGFLEEHGFLKVDILGLSNLTFVHNIISLVKENHHIDIDFYNLKFDDPRIYDVIRNGHTLGLFQLESAGMRKAIATIKPTNFDDVSALLALYRPGPMKYIDEYALRKEGKSPITYINDDLIDILKPTYGIMIYQEQIMQIAATMAGFSLGQADILRRAIGRKDEKIILEQKDAFFAGAKKRGYSRKDTEKVFDDILRFADYGFNKSHSVVYAMLTTALAYLKTYYPYEFYQELLRGLVSDNIKFTLARQELKALNIKISRPCVLKSTTEFIRTNNSINFPLSAINGLNRESANIIIRLREQKAFSSVQDFFFRSFKAGVTAEEFIALIEAGALDSFNTNRAQLKVMFNTYLPTLDIGLFDNEAALHAIIVPETKESDDRLDLEISRLRFPLSGNPLDKLKLKDIERVSHILELEDGYIKTYGVLTSLRLIKTKKGDEMAFATASDYEEEINLVFFPRVLAEVKGMLTRNNIYIMAGKLETRDGQKQLVVNTLERVQNE